MRVPLLVNRGMASKIAQTTRKAFEIFSVESVTKDKLQELVQLTAQLTARDINLNLEQVRRERVTRAPVSYMEIFVNKALTVCVFVLWDDTKMPMHNHPDMHGILKVLHGTVRVQSYTEAQLNNNSGERNVVPENCKKASWLWNRDRTLGGDGKEEYVLAKKHEAIFLNAGENEAPAILYPIDGNIHEIQAVDGPAAFLDILAPSYEARFSY
ncbi:unnamed protein product [Notodromas monacha]|uniref:Cysteine dioxygenase n=1 Tax=Notodromas monacha TaxID=399045 RepID=A0A7R9GFG8_9CRUS|nr:unnamed protein product [Notodromas monacha]CAG0920772.1 unnamed protein product [Notodromas monacha]